jgi:hypothetical protein
MLTQDSEMTWNWTPQYWLQVVAGANGQVSGVTNGWRAANAEVAGILAVPHGRYEYVFSMWTGDVPAGSETSNPLSLTMNAARAVTALFAPAQKTSRGTPHPWIAQYYATNDYENCDGEDSDGDGRQTWQEYVTGTDPTDPSSVFRVVKVTLLNGSNRIDTYVTTNSGIFDPLSMYRSTELGLEWILVATNDIPRTSSTGTNTWWDVWPPTNARAFYRPAATNSTR